MMISYVVLFFIMGINETKKKELQRRIKDG